MEDSRTDRTDHGNPKFFFRIKGRSEHEDENRGHKSKTISPKADQRLARIFGIKISMSIQSIDPRQSQHKNRERTRKNQAKATAKCKAQKHQIVIISPFLPCAR